MLNAKVRAATVAKPKEASVQVRTKGGFFQLVYRINGQTFLSVARPLDGVIAFGSTFDLIKDFQKLTQFEVDHL